MKDSVFVIKVDDTQRRILVNALVQLKEQQKNEKKNTDSIDDIILLVCDAPRKGLLKHSNEER